MNFLYNFRMPSDCTISHSEPEYLDESLVYHWSCCRLLQTVSQSFWSQCKYTMKYGHTLQGHNYLRLEQARPYILKESLPSFLWHSGTYSATPPRLPRSLYNISILDSTGALTPYSFPRLYCAYRSSYAPLLKPNSHTPTNTIQKE